MTKEINKTDSVEFNDAEVNDVETNDTETDEDEGKKYKIREDLSAEYSARTLYRIEALKNFSNVKKGDLGGWIEKEENLSQKGDCWIYDNVKVYDDAIIYDNAKVYGNANVFGKAVVCGDADIDRDQIICGSSIVY
jgi:hypothetical protein